MLSERTIQLTKEVILKAPSTARTEEERDFVAKVTTQMADIKAKGGIPDLPSVRQSPTAARCQRWAHN